MKAHAVLGAFFVTVLAASAASAAGGKESTVKSEKGGGESGSTGTTSGTGTGTITSERDRDKVTNEKKVVKPWEVGASWEAHALTNQNDLEGYAPDKFYNYFYAYGRYEFFKYNRVTLRVGLYQRFIADPGESGARLDDIYAAYTRVIPLPKEFRLSVTGSVIAPTSFISHKEGLVTAPRLTLQLDKELGKYVVVSLRTFGEYDIQTRTSWEDGSLPNPIARMGVSLSSEVTMPFHTPLSAGASLFTGYTWYYDANATTPCLTGYTCDPNMPMVQADPTFSHQPTQQSYGGEVYARYTLPALAGLKTDLKVALAEGDQSILHDGVTHFNMFFRLSTQVYGALTLRY
jgi:hypothetical protein